MPEQAPEEGRYIYCITRGGEHRTFDTRGLGDSSGQVYTIPRAGLSAVVSDSAVVDYERSRRNMIVHTLVQEEVIRDQPILPVRFGTVAPDAESLRDKLLERRRAEFGSLFAEVEGRVELGLKAFWRENVPFGEIIEENEDIRCLRDRLMDRTPEETYYERVRLGQMVVDEVNRRRDAAADAIMSLLRPLACKSKVNVNLGERMVVNAAFLVDKSAEEGFDQTVRELGAQMEHRLAFKYVGPVPPYNFVNIIVSWDG